MSSSRPCRLRARSMNGEKTSHRSYMWILSPLAYSRERDRSNRSILSGITESIQKQLCISLIVVNPMFVASFNSCIESHNSKLYSSGVSVDSTSGDNEYLPANDEFIPPANFAVIEKGLYRSTCNWTNDIQVLFL